MSWYDYIIPQVALSKWLYHQAIGDAPPQPLQPQMTLPSTAEGAAIPLLYGRVRVRQPLIVWSGNYLNPGDVYTRGGLSPATADHYSVDLIAVLGVPFYGRGVVLPGPSVLNTIFVGDAPVASISLGASAGAGAQPFHFPLLPVPATTDFSVGGVFYQGSSYIDVTNTVPMDGGSTFPDGVSYGTTTSAFAALFHSGVTASQFPGMRNQTAVFMHVATGTSPSITGFGFEVTSLSSGTASDLGNSLSSDADPAAVVFDLLTSPWGKIGYDSAQIDRPSFVAASATLFSEGHGYSRIISEPGDASAILIEIMRQIGAVFYVEPTTGKIVIKLIRGGYDVSTLDDINPSNTSAPAGEWFSVQGFAEQPNQVRLTYTNRVDNYNNATLTAQNPSSVAANGGRLRTLEVSFPGCCTAALAGTLLARELGVVSRPMVKATVKVNRSFYAKRIGDVVTLTWPELGIDRMVMRIARINRGKPGASMITMELIRDVFDVTTGAFPAA